MFKRYLHVMGLANLAGNTILRRHCRFAALVVMATAATVTTLSVARAQTVGRAAFSDIDGYQDLKALKTGVYGVELRGTADSTRLDARVGTDTTAPDVHRADINRAQASQPFTVTWSKTSVSVTLDGQPIRHDDAWQVGNAIRISARGGVRVRVLSAGGRPATGTAERSDVIVSDPRLTSGWTLEGVIDWPATPGSADGVVVTSGHQTTPGSADVPLPNFSGGLANRSALSLAGPPPPSGKTPSTTERVWTGDNGNDWNDPGNWDPFGVPRDGERLIFDQRGRNDTTNNNIMPSPNLGGISVDHPNFRISGLGLTLANNSHSTLEKDLEVDRLSGGGTIEMVKSNVALTIGHQDSIIAQSTFSGTISGDRTTLIKDGPSQFTFTGDADGVQEANIREGFFALDGGTLSETTVTGRTTTFVMRDGWTGALNVRNDSTFGDASATGGHTGDLELEDSNYIQPISGDGSFQKLIVHGSVRVSHIGRTELSVRLIGGYRPPVGASFIIVDNDGNDPVDGTFHDLPEGAIIDAGRARFRISYRAGTGNDIGLTCTESDSIQTGDLAISQTASNGFQAGGTGTFTINVRNVGTASITGTTKVTDTLPVGFVPNSASGMDWGCTINGRDVSCSRLSTLAPSASFPAITISVQLALTAQTATNIATVTTVGDFNETNDQSQLNVPVAPPAPPVRIDLTLSKAHSNVFQQGGTGSFQVLVQNAGTVPSSGLITLTDTLPSGLAPASASGAGWLCGIAQQTVTCSRNDVLAAGSSFSGITIDVNVSSTAPSEVTNTVQLSGGGDTTPANNDATDIVAIAPPPRPDLQISKTQVDSPFTPGQTNAKFMLIVSNSGPGATSGLVTATDALPTGLTPTAAAGTGWTCNVVTQTVTCNRSDVLAATGQYPPITISVTVALTARNLSNTAQVQGANDRDPSNNSQTIPVVITVPEPVTDLIVEKTHAGEVAQGGTVTFQIVVRNIAPGASSGEVVVTDPVPASLTPTAAAGVGWTCDVAQTVTCRRSDSLGPLSAFPPIALTANVSPTAVGGVNTATVSGGNDSATANNTASDPFSVQDRSADLTIAASHSGSFIPGQTNATFTINVSNVGPVPSSGAVSVLDILPNGFTPTSATGTGWSCPITGQQVQCTRSDALANGSSYPVVTIVSTVSASAESGENVAGVSGGGDTNTANNVARDSFVVLGVPNLTITKTHSGDFTVGQQGATYTIAARNAGLAATAGTVQVDDPLPSGLSPVSAVGTGWICSVSGQSVGCSRTDALAAGDSWPAITITLNVGQKAGSVTNIATVTLAGEVRTDDNTAADPTTILGHGQLTIVKTHTNPVTQGDQDLPFEIIVSNNGTGGTTGLVTVTDTLPAGLTLTDASGPGWQCAVSGATATCTRSDVLPQGAQYPLIQIRANVAADAVSVTNDVTVAGGGDTTPADNVFHDRVAITPPAGQPNLVLEKRHDADFKQGQANAQYRLFVSNQGSRPSEGEVVLTDTLPAGLTLVSAAGTGWTCTLAAPNVDCRRSDVLQPQNAFSEITILVNVAATATDVVNVAQITGGGDATPADNTASDPTHIVVVPLAPDLTVSKQHNDPFIAGQQNAEYRITVKNAGAGPTSGEVVVTDQAPAGLDPQSASGTGWACAFTGRTMTCRRSDSLAAGATYPLISLLVAVEVTASNTENVVVVSGGGDTTPANNTDSDPTSINVSPDPTIALRRLTPLVVSTLTDYDVVINNLGPGSMGGETSVVTTFSSELLPVLAQGDGWQCVQSGQQMQCDRTGTLAPNDTFPSIHFQALVRSGPSHTTVSSRVTNKADINVNNNQADLAEDSTLPAAALRITHNTATPRVGIGGVAGYSVTVTNTGQVRLLNVVVRDLLPRGFTVVDRSREVDSSTRTVKVQTASTVNAELVWPILTLAPDETLTASFQALVGADARTGPQISTASASGTALSDQVVSADKAVATVEVANETFSMLQMVAGRVFEDVDGNGMYGPGDHPIKDARVVTSTGQAAITDEAGLYNIPSLSSGSVAISLDPLTLSSGYTLDGGPGGSSWTRLLRTPVGGGTLLTQNFAVRQAAATPVSGGRSSQSSSLLVALGEVSFGRASQEFEFLEKNSDVSGYGSLFYRGTVASEKNRLTLSFDSHRRLNHTTDRDRLFELDPNDRQYPVFGDSSVREELAMSNSKLYAKFERGASYMMFGDVAGDLPSSRTNGGRLSSYQRNLTGAEFKLADRDNNYAMLRTAKPSTAYARDVSAGRTLGVVQLTHSDVLTGTEVVAVEVRDRRMPDRLLSREVLERGVDYQLEPGTGTIFLTRRVGILDASLDLVQIVITYEYQNQGVNHLVFSGRAQGKRNGAQFGTSFFTEEGMDDRFTLVGLDVDQPLPHAGRVRVDLPYSTGTPNVTSSVDQRQVDPGRDTGGIALQADLEQPYDFWQGVAHVNVLHADSDFRNPFGATVTPGSTYIGASTELKPRSPSRLKFGATYERHSTLADVGDATRMTFSTEWAEKVTDALTLSGGYDTRSLDRAGTTLNSGLFTGQAIYKHGRIEGRVGREQNVREDTDPTYPDQTTLGAKYRINMKTSLFYSQRISDKPIVPVGDFTGTGLSALATTNELNFGVESGVTDNTQLTSQYRIEQGINGPDAFAVFGTVTHFKVGPGLGLSFGGEHGEIVSGLGSSFTNGTAGLDWTRSNRIKAAARYDMRDRDGLAHLFTGGGAARLRDGITTLGRVRWVSSDASPDGNAFNMMLAFAVRPATNDHLGWLMSYQFLNRDNSTTVTVPGLSVLTWRHLLSTDGYFQPVRRLEFHGKGTWQRSEAPAGFATDTYLTQGRVQLSFSRWVDSAFEERYIWQPQSDSHRTGSGAEVGFWPLADFRLALGYSFQDTRDPYGRDSQGRAKGAYFTISTKLSRLFDLLGTAAAPAR